MADLDFNHDIELGETNTKSGSTGPGEQNFEFKPFNTGDNQNPSNLQAIDANSLQSNTLEEPVTVTIKRELSSILTKIKYTFKKGDTQDRLNELLRYDLWGPFLFYLTFAS